MAKGPRNQQMVPHATVIHPNEVTKEAKLTGISGLAVYNTVKWLVS